MKRLGLFIAIMLLVVLGGTFWLYQKLEVQKQAELYDALPKSASFFLEIEDWASFKSKFESTEYYNSFSSTPVIQKLLRQANTMDRLLAEPDSGSSLFDNRKLLLNIALTNAGEYDFLYLLETKNLNKAQFHAFAKKLSATRKIDERNYKGLSIFETNTDLGLLTIAFDKGVLMASFTSFLLEESVEELQKDSWLKADKDFQSLKKLAESSGAVSAFIKTADEALLTELLIDQEHLALKKFARNFTSWLQLEITFESNRLLLNGYSVAGNSSFLSKYISYNPANTEVGDILPVSTALFVNTNAPVLNFPNEEGNDFTSYFKDWLGNSRGFAIGHSLDENWEKELFLYFQSDNTELAMESLHELAKLQGYPFEQEYNAHKIGRVKGAAYDDLIDLPQLGIKDPYYCNIGDFILFANSIDALKKVIRNYLNGNTLARNKSYVQFSRQISSSSNFSIHFQAKYSLPLLKSILNASLSKALEQEEKNWNKIAHNELQFSSFNDMYFANMLLEYNPEAAETSATDEKLWKLKLDTNLFAGPFILKNHNNSRKEIFLQDINNKIYLIDRTGKLLWEKQLDAPIKSAEVYQIDYYKNGKLQMLFNTEEHIHIIDREGNNVAGFPIKLPVKSSNGVLLTNYDAKRVYRYFMAGKNKIYGFYQSGKPLPGWSPKNRAGKITQPLEYCQIDGIDYLIAVNEDGELFYFDRRGEKKVDPILTKTKFSFPFSFIATKKDFNLYNFDTESRNLFIVNKLGKFLPVALKDTFSFFDFAAFDLDGDGQSEMLFTDSNSIYVYNDKMEQLNQISSPILLDSKAFQVGDKIGFFSKSSKQILLLNSDYSLLENFPKAAESKFTVTDLFDNKKQVLISVEDDKELSAVELAF